MYVISDIAPLDVFLVVGSRVYSCASIIIGPLYIQSIQWCIIYVFTNV